MSLSTAAPLSVVEIAAPLLVFQYSPLLSDVDIAATLFVVVTTVPQTFVKSAAPLFVVEAFAFLSFAYNAGLFSGVGTAALPCVSKTFSPLTIAKIASPLFYVGTPALPFNVNNNAQRSVDYALPDIVTLSVLETLTELCAPQIS